MPTFPDQERPVCGRPIWHGSYPVGTLQSFHLAYLFSRPVPKKWVHVCVTPEISLIVRVTHALPHGPHQAAVLVTVLS